ncbi:hypothetical protein BC833DRAFT_595806 [Globomyces pollinis-pini]|nr:hypothetical protein BC833DRAFT_595806 [Globomyces pollinis-pini]
MPGDQFSFWKGILIFLAAIAFIITWMAMILILVRINWKPFKSKQPYVLLVSLVASTFWWIGSAQSLGVIPQVGIFSDCAFWTIWIQLVFGVQLAITCMAYRLLRLYYILVLSKVPDTIVFPLIIFLSHLPSVILGILPILRPNYYVTQFPSPIKANPTGPPACDFTIHPYYINVMFSCAGVGLVVLSFLNYKISRVRRAFNEFKEINTALYVLTVILLLNVALNAAGFQNYDAGKGFSLLTQIVACMTMFWSIMFASVRGYLTDKDGYFSQWKQGLKDESLPSALQYGAEGTSTYCTTDHTKSTA